MTRRSLLPLPLLVAAVVGAWALSAIGDDGGGAAPTDAGTAADEQGADNREEGAAGAKASAGPSPAATVGFTTPERIPVLENNGEYPCSLCHDDSMPADPTVREIAEHDFKLEHGGGRFWCLTCHHPSDRDALIGLNGKPISFDEPHLLCGQCHADVQKDFEHGAHGKRLNSWRGPRVYTACTACHDAHAPAIKPRKPLPPERLREGLLRRGHGALEPLPHHKAPAADGEETGHE